MAVTETDPPAAEPTPPSEERPAARLPFFPAIEGLRGVAVAAVLLFHAGFSWMSGGFLGVSTFFTLSGFLITSLLLVERGAAGTMDLRRFWTRRWRRILPAALLALTIALVFGVIAADAVQRRNLAGDTLAALAFVANWRFIFSSQSYADLFGAPSPVLQFWSLAIEEQFYLLYPVLAWALLLYYRVHRWLFGAVISGLIGFSLISTLFFGYSLDRIYYGTDTRAAELLMGALLAVVIYDRRVTTRLARDLRVRKGVGYAGSAALLVCVYLWVTATQGNAWLYEGGFAGYAILSSLVVLACVVPGGPIQAVLGLAPIRALGRISYGVYLFHWPIFLFFAEDRTGLRTEIVVPVEFAVTIAVALISYRFIETPLRRGDRIFGRAPSRLFPYAAGAIAIIAIVLTVTAPKPLIDFDAAAAQLQSLGQTGPPPTIDPASTEPPFPRMAVFGDSTALMTGMGLNAWAGQSKQAAFVDGAAWLGCGIGRNGERRSGNDQGPIPEACNHWELTWTQKMRNSRPNIAVVQIGPWEVADRKLDGETVWRAPGDPVYDAYLRSEMLKAVDTLSAEGAEVMWLTSPPVGAGKGEDARKIRGQGADPMRMARLNELINELPGQRAGKVRVIDLADWLARSGEDARLRPDGVHFGQDESREVANRYLGAAIVDAYREDWHKRRSITDTNSPGTTTPTPGTTPGTAPPVPTIPTVTEPPNITYTTRNVLVLGDETSVPIAAAVKSWGDATGAFTVNSVVTQGCGIVRTGARTNKSTQEPTPEECANSSYLWLQAVVAANPDLVVIVPTVWDVADNQLVDDATWRAPGDPTYDAEVTKQYSALVDAIHKAGPAVAWLTAPPFTLGQTEDPPPATAYPASDAARTARINELITTIAAATPYLLMADFAHYADGWPNGARDSVYRPDGLSVGDAKLTDVGQWLGPELYTKYDEYDAFRR